MQKDHIYNLIQQYSVEHQSLWRIKEMYLKDASHAPEEVAFWESLAKQKEATITSLQGLLGAHLK